MSIGTIKLQFSYKTNVFGKMTKVRSGEVLTSEQNEEILHFYKMLVKKECSTK